ncbi:MAG: rhodanese-like domain-containing protein [Myxococcota bacterium]
MSIWITPEELRGESDVVLIDARMEGLGAYFAGHLESAVFADLERDLSQPEADVRLGGRHPLPPIEVFAATVGSWGIDRGASVVVYDAETGALAAARCWWMLKALGHADVRVLSGGLKAAVHAGFSLCEGDAAGNRHSPKPPYPARTWLLPTRSFEEIAEHGERYTLLDVRSRKRFEGTQEHLDPPGGHIPFAVNLPYQNLIDDTGRMLPAVELRRIFEALPSGLNGSHAGDNTVFSCGSGVTACYALLALCEAFGSESPTAALYVGSYSEWSRRMHPDGA